MTVRKILEFLIDVKDIDQGLILPQNQDQRM